MRFNGTEQTNRLFSSATLWSDIFILRMTAFTSSREAWELLNLQKITCFEKLIPSFQCLKECLIL